MPSFDKAIDAIAALREAMAAPQPEPVALESVHLTRDIKGMCTVRVNGRVAIQDNDDIINHMVTLEWFAQPAPVVPLTDEQRASEYRKWYQVGECSMTLDAVFDEGFRWAEKVHGITGGKP